MFCIATKGIDAWLGVTGGSRESGAILDPVFQTAVLCIGLIILGRRNFNWSAVIRENIWAVLLVGYMLVTIIWSDIPFISFKRWVRELTALIMAFVVLSESAPRQAIESLLRRTVYVLIPFSVLLIKYYQDIGVAYSPWTGEVEWIGVTVQKNGLGRLCLISAFFLIWTLIGRWQKTDVALGKYQTGAEVILLIMTLWLLKGPSMWAASVTAICSLSLGLLTLCVLLWMRRHRIQLAANVWVATIACIIGFGIITPFVGGSTVKAFTSTVGRNATLTGRTDIWAGLLPDVTREPFLGHGFGSFWTAMRIREHNIGEAHNGYLEVCLGLGFAGLALTAIFLLSSTRKAATLLSRDYDWAALCICFLVMAAIHNISESSFDSFNRQLLATLLFLSVSAPLATKYQLAYGYGRGPTNRFGGGMQLAAERQKR